MTDKNPAPERLVLGEPDDCLIFSRFKDKTVKVHDAAGDYLCQITRDEWQEVANFFHKISVPGAML